MQSFDFGRSNQIETALPYQSKQAVLLRILLGHDFFIGKSRLWFAERAKCRGSHGGAPETGFNQNITKWQLTSDRCGSTKMFDGVTAWHNTFINCGYNATAQIRSALCKSAGSVTMSHGPGYGPPSAWKVIPPLTGTLPPTPPPSLPPPPNPLP